MGLLSSLGRDLKFALRQMRQTPIVSGVALLSLALGIGANVAIFSLVNALILKALPIHEPERLVQLQLTDTNPRNHTTSFTNPQWEYLRDHQDIFTGVTAVGLRAIQPERRRRDAAGARPVCERTLPRHAGRHADHRPRLHRAGRSPRRRADRDPELRLLAARVRRRPRRRSAVPSRSTAMPSRSSASRRRSSSACASAPRSTS